MTRIPKLNGAGSSRALPFRTNGASASHPEPLMAGEALFSHMLHQERRRTERSKNRFVLLLVSTLDLNGETPNRLQDILLILSHSIRETDFIGWYRAGTVIGVIFTELGHGDPESAIGTLRGRVMEALAEGLGAHLKNIHLEFHPFPENWDERNQDPSDHALYQDLDPRAKGTQVGHIVKRSTDILGSLLALVLLSPLFAVIAAAVKLSSPGPVLYRQSRVGQWGRKFTFLKFRSMYDGNDNRIHKDYVKRFIDGGAAKDASKRGNPTVYKLTDDPRVTPIGKFIRKTSLDELPQFWNVLCGDMSLVGPRPPVPYECEAYDTWHRRRLLEAKPGITGLWQVEGRSKLAFADMVRLDLKYAQSWSLWLDLKILMRTPKAVLSGNGAH